MQPHIGHRKSAGIAQAPHPYIPRRPGADPPDGRQARLRRYRMRQRQQLRPAKLSARNQGGDGADRPRLSPAQLEGAEVLLRSRQQRLRLRKEMIAVSRPQQRLTVMLREPRLQPVGEGEVDLLAEDGPAERLEQIGDADDP
ncbi:hypothetical protein D3C81_356930 [compost metagenome]